MDVRDFIIAGFLLISIAGGCDSSSVITSPPPPSIQDTGIEVTGFKAFSTYEGKPKYMIESTEARVIEKDNYVEMRDIHLTFFKENSEEIAGELKANEGIYYFRDNAEKNHHANDIELKGNVVFQTTDGTFLKTSEVLYDNATEKIISRSEFEKRKVGKDQTLIIKGKGFVTDKSLRRWEDKGATMTLEAHSSGESKEP
ncbi:LPS export ABC transporter periplasmic protein LptC [Candidatus Sumerlaeota bacterium]|nr:LPS export ABC transporter periplasmic protein LptC [Candidatus Sumerlaeota bacterium]